MQMEAFVHVSTRSISLRHIKMHQIISYYYISLSTNAIIPTGKLCHDEWEGRVPCNLHERTDIVPFLSLFFTSQKHGHLGHVQFLFCVPSSYGTKYMSPP